MRSSTHYLVKPHSKIARDVEIYIPGEIIPKDKNLSKADYARIQLAAPVMLEICRTKCGIYNNALAISHPQVDDIDPLRFFVLSTSQAIINPVIKNRTKHFIDSEEGCYSYADKQPVTIKRSHKITVDCWVMLWPYGKQPHFIKDLELAGREAFIYQHEIDHFDGKSIYDEAEKH